MKKIVAALLAVLYFTSSICQIPVMASELPDTSVSGTVSDEIPEETSLSEDMFIEEADVPEEAEIIDDLSEVEVPNDDNSVSDAPIAEDVPAVDESELAIPADTDSVAAEIEAEDQLAEELVGTAASMGQDAGITTGDYYIVSAMGTDMKMHVKSKSVNNSANIMVYQSNGSEAQRFHVTNYGNGVYGITNTFSNKALTVSAASTAAGANVVQYTDNDMDNKRWYIQTGTISGCCTIQTRLSKNVLSIEGGNAVNYANVFVDANKNTAAQQWKFVAAEPLTTTTWSKGDMKTGYYMIESKLKSGRYLEVAFDNWANGANIQLGPTCSAASRVFYITNLGNGRFRMQSCLNGNYMEVLNNTMARGTNIRTAAQDSGAKQIFYVSTNRTDGYYFIKPSQNIHNYAIGVTSGNTALGTNIYLTAANPEFRAQQFRFVPVSAPNVEVNEGAYQITFGSNANYVISIPAKNNSNNSSATLYKNEANNYQKFNIVPLGNGYCKVLVAANQKALTVKNGGTGNNVDVVQQDYKGTDDQKWKIEGCRNKLKFVSKLNGKALTSKSSSAANSVNLVMYTNSSSYNSMQTFGLTKTTVSTSGSRGYVYQTDPATKKSVKLEAQFLSDPVVSDTDFLAAVLYTEAGDQGVPGMMMVAYVIKTRMAEGLAAAKAGKYVEYPGTLKYMIYQYGQWQVARDGTLTRVLTDISVGEASYLSKARQAATNANNKKDIVLEANATKYVKKTASTSTQTTLKSGTKIKASEFTYNSFMTPAAWTRYATSGSYPKFATGYGSGKNSLLYKGHVFFMDEEVW